MRVRVRVRVRLGVRVRREGEGEGEFKGRVKAYGNITVPMIMHRSRLLSSCHAAIIHPLLLLVLLSTKKKFSQRNCVLLRT